MWDVIIHLCHNFYGQLTKFHFRLGNGRVIASLFYVDVITYPCPKFDYI